MIATHRQFKTGELAWICPLYGHNLQHVPVLVLIVDAEHHQVLFDERVRQWSGPWFKTKEDADVAIEKKRETMRSFVWLGRE